MDRNIDYNVVHHFGREWSKFDQSRVSEEELQSLFEKYFSVFPWETLPGNACGFDLGCGSGRWARFVAPRVKRLHCLDPSEAAINVAKRNLQQFDNCRFHVAGIDEMPLDNDSMDFGYCIGVLHAVPDPLAGIRSCAEKLRPGAPLLLYMHYAFDNRPQWFRFLWKAADLFRRAVSRFPGPIKYITSQCIALLVYFPLARSARLAEKWGMNVTHFPLSLYRDKSFYTMRTDALDRFGTRLEKRFTKDQIAAMMIEAGLDDLRFREEEPFWCVVGTKALKRVKSSLK